MTLKKKMATITNNCGKPAYHSSVLGSSANFDPRNYYNLDYDTLQNYLKEGMLDKEKEMIDLVGKLIMERLDQLLDKDTDEIIKILVENKIFEEENGKLWDRVHELENRIDELNRHIIFLESKDTQYSTNNDYWTTYPYTTTSPSWGSVVPGDLMGTGEMITLSTTSGPVTIQEENKQENSEEKSIVSRIMDSLGLKKDTGSDQSKAL